MHRFLSFLLLVSLIVCFLPACRPVGTDASEVVLRVGNAVEPATLDPQLATGEPEFRIIRALFSGLVRFDPETLEIVPDLAESWEICDDGLLYTFQLRENLMWSNGEELSATDAVFTFRRLLNPSIGAPYTHHAFAVRGAESFFRGESDFEQVGVRAIDANTLEITLTKPLPFFLQLLAHPSLFPLPSAFMDAIGAESSRGAVWLSNDHSTPFSGPFTLESWRPRERIRVMVNSSWHRPERGNITAIEFFPEDNPQTEERSFRNGRLHATANVPLDRVGFYLSRNDPALRIDPDFGTYYLLLNTKHPVLAESKVRQALSLSIDRQAIAEGIRQRGESPARHFTPPAFSGYTPPKKIGMDVQRARELLASAGYPKGEGFPEIRFLFNISESHAAIAEALQSMWQENLNIHIQLNNREWGTYLNLRQQGDFDILRATWLGDFYDPATFLELWTSQSQHNYGGWNDAQYDAFIQSTRESRDSGQRMNYFYKAEERLLEDVPVIPIFFLNRAFLLNPIVRNWYPNPLNIQDWGILKFKE